MSVERDYRLELEQGLQVLFGDGLVSYDLQQDRNASTMFLLGGFGNKSGQIQNIGPITYRLSVQVHVNVSDYLTRSSMVLTRKDIVIGPYGPVSMHETQDLHTAKVVMRLDYSVTDLNDFLNVLKEKTWGKYEQEFTQQLEAKLKDQADDS